MGEKIFDFWQDHSLRLLEMAFSADRREVLDHPDARGKRTGVCGDTVEMFLMAERGRIRSVSFDTDGCIYTSACANTVARLAEGKTPDEAWGIVPEDIENYLETLPPDQFHCAELAVGALYLALADLEKHTMNRKEKP